MIAFFRKLAQSKILWILLGIPMVGGLLMYGPVRGDFSGLLSRDAVISVGSRTLSSTDYKREFEGFHQQVQQQQGQPVSIEDMAAQGLDQQVLQGLARRESLAEELHRIGIIPADSLVVDQIRKITAFFNPVTGKFDQQAYLDRLGQAQLTPEIFQAGLRDETASDQFTAGLAAALKPPRLLAAAITDAQFAAHQFSYFAVSPKVLGAPPTPTDDQLKQLMATYAAPLTTPEMRDFTVVRFSAKALEPTIVPDPAEVKKRYDFRKDTLSTPEKRTLVEIPAKTAADAAQIAAKLAAGQDPAAVARAAGVEPLNYTDQAKGGVVDPKVADVAFSLPEGKTSGPIQGQLGYAVVKVLKITPAHEVSYEEARPKIEDEVKAEMAATKAYELSQKYEDAHDKGANLVEAAKAAGVTPEMVGPVSAQGADADGKPVMGLTPKLLKAGFALNAGQETDVNQEDKGEYFAVRADKVLPPAPPSLDKDRAKLTQLFQATEMQKRMTAKLQALAAEVKKGQNMDAVAATVDSKVQQASLNREQAQQMRQMRPEDLAAIFNAKPGDVFTSSGAVIRLTAVQPPPAALAAAAVGQAQELIARQMVDEFGEESRLYLETTLKPKINYALAREAIGLPAQSSAPPAAGAAGLPSPAGRAQ